MSSHVQLIPTRDSLPYHKLQVAAKELREANTLVEKKQAAFDEALAEVEEDIAELRNVRKPAFEVPLFPAS